MPTPPPGATHFNGVLFYKHLRIGEKRLWFHWNGEEWINANPIPSPMPIEKWRKGVRKS